MHRLGCPNIRAAEIQGQRLVDVQWEDESGLKPNYDADLTVHGENRNGLLNDVLRSIAGHVMLIQLMVMRLRMVWRKCHYPSVLKIQSS